MLSLYFKVRSHSFAKDIVDKHKVIKNNNWRTIQKKITCKYNITKKETIMKTNMKIIKRIMCKYDTFQLKEKEKSFEYKYFVNHALFLFLFGVRFSETIVQDLFLNKSL